MQYSGIFAFFWYALARTADEPVTPRDAEIAHLESVYRGVHVPLTAVQISVRFAALVVTAVLVAVATAVMLTPG